MDISHWWLVKLAVLQVIYLAVVIWGMHALNRKLARVRVDRSVLHPAATAQHYARASRISKQ